MTSRLASLLLACLALAARGAAADAPAPAAQATPGPAAEGPPLERLPTVKRAVRAEYPPQARAAGVEAVVVLDLDVDERGRVERVEVAASSTSPGLGFEEAARAAAAQLEFEPALAGGQPVPVRISWRAVFALPRPPAAPARRAPVANLEGQLLERGTRAPLAGARVTVFRDGGEAFEALTDAEGRFRFFDLSPGAWSVLAEAEGHLAFRTSETVAGGERLEARYHVERTSYGRLDVLVEGERPRKEVARRTLAAEEIEKIPGSFGDAIAAVANLPSVARPPVGLGSLIVRGSSPDDTRIAVGGVDVPLAYHFGSFRSVLPTAAIEAIDFYPGNFSPAYGRATGGFLDVRPKRLAPERATGNLDLNALDASGWLELPIGKDAALAVGLRRSWIDAVLGAVIPADAGTSFKTAPRYYDLQVLGSWRPDQAQRLEALVFAADDKMELIFKQPADLDPALRASGFDAATRFVRGVVTHTWAPGSGLENELRLSAGRDSFATHLGARFAYDLDLWVLHARDRLHLPLSAALAVDAGVDARFERTSGAVRSLGLAPPQEGDTTHSGSGRPMSTSLAGAWNAYPAAWAELEWRPWSGLQVSPGLRVDWFGGTRQLTADPRLAVRQALSAEVLLKAGAGLYHQEPSGDQLDAAFGNPALRAFWALHTTLGMEVRPLPHLTFDVSGFYKEIRDLPGRSDRLIERDGRLVPEVYVKGARGRVYGLDLLVRHQLSGGLSGWIAYTLSRAERRDPGASSDRLFDFDQTHILSAVASYRLTPSWEVSLRWRLVSGKPFTPITGGSFDSDLDAFQPVTGAVNSERMGAFHQLDLRVDKRWVFDRWMLSAYLDLQNAYNRANPEGLSYRWDYRASKVSSGLPVLPVIGLRAEL